MIYNHQVSRPLHPRITAVTICVVNGANRRGFNGTSANTTNKIFENRWHCTPRCVLHDNKIMSFAVDTKT